MKSLVFFTNRRGRREFVCVCVCMCARMRTRRCSYWNLEQNLTRMHANIQDRVDQGTGEWAVPGSWKWSAHKKEDGSARSPNWKSWLDFLFKVFWISAVGFGLRREFWRKTPFCIEPGYLEQSYIMHMGAWEACFRFLPSQADHITRIPIWWISEVSSSYRGFQADQAFS